MCSYNMPTISFLVQIQLFVTAILMQIPDQSLKVTSDSSSTFGESRLSSLHAKLNASSNPKQLHTYKYGLPQINTGNVSSKAADASVHH